MKKTIAIIATMAVSLLTTSAMALPQIIKAEKSKTVTVDELIDHMGQFDAFDVLDMADATSISFHHVPDAYNFDEYSRACSAMDVAGLHDLRSAIASSPEVVEIFESNGYAVNDVVAIVHNPGNNSFDVYLR